MPFKGLIAVSLFFASMVASSLSTAPTNFDWSHDAVVAGSTVTVKVSGAPCQPVTVVVYVNGEQVGSGTVSEFPGGVTVGVPAGTQGGSYTIVVRCPNDRTTETGPIL
jgi:hypothetical protein